MSILGEVRVFLDAVSSRLAREDGMEIGAVAGSIRELLAAARTRPVELLLVHLGEETPQPAEVVWDLKTLFPHTRIIVAGCKRNELEIVKLVEGGASAYLEHDTSYQVLLQTIRDVFEARTSCSLGVLGHVARRMTELAAARQDADQCGLKRLSSREVEVARLMALGLSNRLIAKRLKIRPPTAKNHVHSVLHKLMVKRRWEIGRTTLMRRRRETGWRPNGPMEEA
ncbi:MAG: hypothetical protein A2V70_17485 [Planctomycetes bacterium RBG_13_63_9]|nr:MAG: hypothetical protein A2V70_17485 [Planctomycetes bacterium RBG_13_63_9]